jgi:DNA invertase Pin-like site-specific DNA recombinase
MRVAIYARVSTTRQAETDPYDLYGRIRLQQTQR